MMQKGFEFKATRGYIEGPWGSQREGPGAMDLFCVLPNANRTSTWADDALVSDEHACLLG